MKISLIGYSNTGGAGNALDRLYQGFLDAGEEIQCFLVKNTAGRKDVIELNNPSKEKDVELFRKMSYEQIQKGHTKFSIMYPGFDFSEIQNISECSDIINLQWISNSLTPEGLAFLSHQDSPLVWTFQDKNPLTGGCHVFHGCEKWRDGCVDCPQLKDNFKNMPANVFATKKKYINFDNITVIVLNEHFRQLAKQSPLFKNCRIEKIHNSVDIKLFSPRPKAETRKKLRISEKTKIITYVADYGSIIKGYSEFEETISIFKKKYNYTDVKILLIGTPPKKRKIELPYKDLGFVSLETLIDAYCTSDLVVVSSIEDNQPNILLESFACGTPVVGFKVGGIPDMIEDGYNGYTVDLQDCESLAQRVDFVLNGPDLSSNCREYAEKNLSLETQVSHYRDLFEDILKKKNDSIKEKKSRIPEISEEVSPSLIYLYSKALENIQNSFGVKQEKRMRRVLSPAKRFFQKFR